MGVSARSTGVLTDVIDGAGTELAVELLGFEALEVMNGEGPQVEDVVPGEGVSLLDHHHFTAQQRQLDGCTETTRSSTDDQALGGVTSDYIRLLDTDVLVTKAEKLFRTSG